MSDSRWVITYNGPRESVTDAGLTFTRGEPQETTDQAVGDYFSSKTSFVVTEVGESAELKKDSNSNNLSEKTSKTSEEQVQENVAAENKDEEVVVQTPVTPVELPNHTDFAQNLVARAQIAGHTSDPGVPQGEQPKEEVKETSTRKSKKSKKETSDVPDSDFFATQMLTDDDLK